MTPAETLQTNRWLLSSAVVSSTFAIAIIMMAVMGAWAPIQDRTLVLVVTASDFSAAAQPTLLSEIDRSSEPSHH